MTYQFLDSGMVTGAFSVFLAGTRDKVRAKQSNKTIGGPSPIPGGMSASGLSLFYLSAPEVHTEM